jgi:CBS domain containing-hemolysin-like protein
MIPASDSRAGAIVRGWMDNPAARDRLIAASQLGITVVSLALGAAGENTFEELLTPYFENLHLPGAWAILDRIFPVLPLVISLTLVTSVHVVLGEQVPKVATLRSPEKFALTAAPFMNGFASVFKGFVSLLDWATRQVLALAGIPPASPHSSVYSLEELRQIVAGPEVEGVIEKPERDMLSAVIDFGELIVRQVSIPRTEIIAVEADVPLHDVITIATQNTVSKLPVYEDNLDQVVDILHVRDLLAAVGKPEHLNAKARDLAREALFVPETISVNDLLHQFRARRTHIAIVLDEFGGTAGLVALEDLVEEIVGEFQGPFDPAQPPIQTLPDGSALVDGLTLIDEINEFFALRLQDPNYDTIAGYVLGKLGRIPKVDDVVEDRDNGVALKVVSMDHLRIARLSLTRLDPPETPA